MRYQLNLLIKHSRPMFWMYLTGPYIVGYFLSIQSLSDLINSRFWIGLIFFSFPANLFLYVVNDISDIKIDSINPKKLSRERVMESREIYYFRKVISVLWIVYLVYGIYLFSYSRASAIIFCFFIFLSYFYSMPPVRFKERYIFDFLSNSLYFLPGVIGFLIIGQFDSIYTINLIIASIFWTSSMHLFSAVVDIDVDIKSGLKTSAVILGRKRSLLFCSLMWLASAVIVTATTKEYLFLILYIYPILSLYSIKLNSLEKLYWKFPVINTLIGFFIILPKVLSLI